MTRTEHVLLISKFFMKFLEKKYSLILDQEVKIIERERERTIEKRGRERKERKNDRVLIPNEPVIKDLHLIYWIIFMKKKNFPILKFLSLFWVQNFDSFFLSLYREPVHFFLTLSSKSWEREKVSKLIIN